MMLGNNDTTQGHVAHVPQAHMKSFLFFSDEPLKILNEADAKLQPYSQVMLLFNVLFKSPEYPYNPKPFGSVLNVT